MNVQGLGIKDTDLEKPPTGMLVHCWASRLSKPCEELDAEARRGALDGGRITHFPYDFGIEADGTVVDGKIFGRILAEPGAHCRGYNGNGNTPRFIGIGLAGNFDEYKPTLAQYYMLQQLIVKLSHDWHIPSTMLYGHYEVNPNKTCPGKFLSMPVLRDELAWAMWPGTKGILNDV